MKITSSRYILCVYFIVNYLKLFRYFATGDSYSTIGHSFRVGFSTVSKIIIEVSEAINKIMGPMFLPEPTTSIWNESAKGFYEKWQYPNCIGSVDGNM